MESFVLVIHVLVALLMIVLILLQQGKGAEMGASFGAGASQTVFGAAGAVGALTKGTAVLAVIFFITSLGLAVYAKKHAQEFGVVPVIPEVHDEKKPAGDVPAAPATAPAAAAPAAGNTDVPSAPAK
ncbi:MAG TPA: preprotein translocase subunit SecG [Moraxellaceae bacterium]